MKIIYFLRAVILILPLTLNLSAQNITERVITIDEMFRLAEKNSKQLKLSNTYIEAAKRTTYVVKKSRMPSIGLSLSASYLGDAVITDRDFTNTETAPMPHFANNFSLEASQVIFAGGAISSSIEKAELEEKLARLNFEKDQIDIRFLLVGYYLDLYKLMNQREVYLRNIGRANLLIDQIKAKQQEGMALTNDVTRYELMLQNLDLALIEIDNNRAIINNHLIIALGLPGTTIKPDTTILSMNMGDISQAEWIDFSGHNNPQIKAAIVSADIAEKNVNIARADYFPALAIVAANHFDGPITVEVPPIDKNLNYWYAGIGLKYNLSSLYTTNREVSLAKACQDAANIAISVVEEQSVLAVQSAYIRYRESFERLYTFEKSLKLAADNYEVINNRYINDLALITEMLDASNSKLEAELQVANAKINIIFNYYKLKNISGIL